MYEPTLTAPNTGDVTYVVTFLLGAIVGLVLFVQLLLWLLSKHRRMTLAVVTGLMAGSLRSLWPWPANTGEAVWPAGDITGPVICLALGATIVGSLLLIEGFMVRRRTRQPVVSTPTS